MPSTHTNGCISNTFVGITLFVNLQDCGRPQEADEQEVDTHVFLCVVKGISLMPELGYHRTSQFYNENF